MMDRIHMYMEVPPKLSVAMVIDCIRVWQRKVHLSQYVRIVPFELMAITGIRIDTSL